MKTKFIVASTIGLLGITSMVIGAVTLADNESSSHNMWRSQIWSGQWMMRKADNVMKQFASTWEAEAFKTAVETAITNWDYMAFAAVHTKYKVNTTVTEEQFKEMITRRSTQEKIQTALTNGDYATWKTLNVGSPILKTITTEAKFKQLQEMHTYQEKARIIGETLGLPWGRWQGMNIPGREGMKMGMNDTATTNQ